MVEKLTLMPAYPHTRAVIAGAKLPNIYLLRTDTRRPQFREAGYLTDLESSLETYLGGDAP